MRNLLRHFFDGVQDFRRDSFANAEVFAFDPVDTQGAWKQSKNSAQVDCLGDSEAVARKLRLAGDLRRISIPDVNLSDWRPRHYGVNEDHVIVFVPASN